MLIVQVDGKCLVYIYSNLCLVYTVINKRVIFGYTVINERIIPGFTVINELVMPDI